jgi:NADPH:quinone reductase-like Zn-dependent oxidoreductase
MKAIVFEQFGEPADVLKLRDIPTPVPGRGQVRVRMIASPINPSDLMVARGRYGVLPPIPATPGFEGVGIVDKTGPGLLGRLVLGKRVAVINGDGGNWAEYVVIPARQARPVARDISDEQVASFFVNPATVLALVRHVLKVPPGAWLLQSAAGSALGRMIIKLGRRDGFKTLGVVRRREAIEELKAVGADAVIASSDGPLEAQIRRIVNDDGVRHAVDCVGGDTGTAMFQSLAPDGRLLVYGSLSGEPLRIDPRLMIAGRHAVEGFWLGHWMRQQSIPATLKLFHDITDLIRTGILATEVKNSYPLDRIAEAVRAAETIGKQGKVHLRMDSSSRP